MSDSSIHNYSVTEGSPEARIIPEETLDRAMVLTGSEEGSDIERANEEDSSSSSYRDANRDVEASGSERNSDVDYAVDPEEGDENANTRDTGDLPPTEDGGNELGEEEEEAADEEASGEEASAEEASAEEASAEEASTDEGSADEDDDESSSETTSTLAGLKKPGRMVSRALEYDLQDMYPEITLLFENKQSAWNCQDPAIIRAMWLESKTNILHDWKLRNGRIRAKDKPKIEVKPTMTFTLRRQHLDEQAKVKDWKEMYIPPGNDPPHYKQLQLPTNLTTEVRYNFTRNHPPVPSSYVLHYEKYRRPPFNVNLPQRCNRSVTH